MLKTAVFSDALRKEARFVGVRVMAIQVCSPGQRACSLHLIVGIALNF